MVSKKVPRPQGLSVPKCRSADFAHGLGSELARGVGGVPRGGWRWAGQELVGCVA